MKTHTARRSLVHSVILSLAVCVLPASATAVENLVKNGDFATDTGGWSLRLPHKTEVFATLARNDSGEASVLIINGGDSKASVMLQHPLSATLVKDAVYVVEFDTRADAPKTIDVVFRSTDNAILGGTYNLPSDPSVSHHKFVYTHTREDAGGVKLTFRIGGNAIPVSFDNVKVTRQPAAP